MKTVMKLNIIMSNPFLALTQKSKSWVFYNINFKNTQKWKVLIFKKYNFFPYYTSTWNDFSSPVLKAGLLKKLVL